MESGSCKVVSCSDLQCLPGSTLQLLRLGWVGQYLQIFPAAPRTGHIWVFARDGTFLSSVELPASGWGWWDVAPSGNVACRWLSPSNNRDLSFWHPATGALCTVDTEGLATINKLIVWSPSSNTLLVRTAETVISMFSSHGERMCPPQDVGLRASHGAWKYLGLALVGLAGFHELRLYVVDQSSALVLRHIVPGMFGNPHFSTDGAHLALNVTHPAWMVTKSLGSSVLVRFQDGSVHEWDDSLRVRDWQDEGSIECWLGAGVFSSVLICFD